jgi:UrcA family protein
MMMKTKFNPDSIKHALVSVIAVSLIALPMLASAAAANSADEKSTIFYSAQNLDNNTDQEVLYTRLKDASRDMCGSSNLHMTGSVERSSGNDKCYEGTLDAAVERLGNSEVTSLHQQES